LNDGVKDGVDDDFSVAAGQISNLCDFFDEVGFGHCAAAPDKLNPENSPKKGSPNAATPMIDAG
jgi:hypothetical protein